MCVCMYVCICIYVYMCVYIYVCVCEEPPSPKPPRPPPSPTPAQAPSATSRLKGTLGSKSMTHTKGEGNSSPMPKALSNNNRSHLRPITLILHKGNKSNSPQKRHNLIRQITIHQTNSQILQRLRARRENQLQQFIRKTKKKPQSESWVTFASQGPANQG